MDLIVELVKQVAVGGAAQVGVALTNVVVGFVREYFRVKKPDDARHAMEALGNTSPGRIRAVAKEAVPSGQQLTPQQREELFALLVNLSRGAQDVASQETASSFADR